MDTLKNIGNTSDVSVSADGKILLLSEFVKYPDGVTYESFKCFDIKNQSLIIPQFSTNQDRVFPKQYSSLDPIYYILIDSLSTNLCCYNLNTSIENQLTNFDDMRLVGFGLYKDSLTYRIMDDQNKETIKVLYLKEKSLKKK